MKTISFHDASQDLQDIFRMAASGETIVIERERQRVAIHRLADKSFPEIAPPGYFEEDYSSVEIEELNRLAARGPQSSIS